MAGRRARELGVYRSPKWKALRKAALKRAKCVGKSRAGRCQQCERFDALAVHHKRSIEAGGDPFPDLDSLIALCRQCHREAHLVERSSREFGESTAAWRELIRSNRQRQP